MSIEALEAGLAAIPAAALQQETSERHGAVLVLVHPVSSGLEIIYTRRQDHLSSHPGQISFPGGRLDPGETVEEAALREAQEEVGLRRDSVEVLGRLPSFYIPPSRFWMTTVVARWIDPHPLTPNPAEVAEVLHVQESTLRDPEVWRRVSLSSSAHTWAWQVAPRRLLWGATAVATGVLLQVMDPDWSGGVQPEHLDDDRAVRPWDDPGSAGMGEGPLPRPRQRLDGIINAAVSAPAVSLDLPDDAQHLAAPILDGLVDACRRLAGGRGGPATVLCGEGASGVLGRSLAAHLRSLGEEVEVIDAAQDADDPRWLQEKFRQAAVIVDALQDRRDRQRAPAAGERVVVRELRTTAAPILSIDLPSGLADDGGMSRAVVSADVTISLGALLASHLAPGSVSFVGDLYVMGGDGELVRPDGIDRSGVWAE